MSKITLNNLANLQNETTAVNTINSNNSTLVTALDNTLSRDGTSPNTMLAPLDMNSMQIINLPTPATNNSPLRLTDLTSFTGGGTVTNIPAGGTQHQVLAKNSSTNYDVLWETPVIGGGTSGQVFIGQSGAPAFKTVSGDITIDNNGVTTIGTNKVTDTKIRQGGAASVIGRSAGSTGNVADISAGSDNHVLRRVGGALGFGQIAATTSLSDYVDSGTWTPVLEGITTAGTQTYNVQVGVYSRFGNIISVYGQILINAKDGATAGNLQIGGLPFAIRNTSGYNPQAVMSYQLLDLNSAGGYYSASGFGQPNTTKIWLFEVGDNVTYNQLPAARFANSTGLVFSMLYVI